MIRRLPFLALVLLASVLFVAPAGASLDDDLSDVRGEMDALRSRISTAAAQQSDLAQAVIAAADALDDADRALLAVTLRFDAVTAEIDATNARLDDVRSLLTVQFEELAAVRVQRDEAEQDARDSLLAAYIGGGSSQPAIAFSATAVNEVEIGMVYYDLVTASSSSAADRFAAIVEVEAEKESEIRDSEAVVQAEVDALEDLRLEIGLVRAEREQRQAELDLKLQEQQALLADVEGEIEQFEGELVALEKEEASIRAEIAAAAAAARKPAVTTTNGYVRPVPGAVSSGFGMRIHPIHGTSKMHNGWDMNAAHGDPIRAMASGTVILAGVKGGYGNTIMIDHGGGLVTLYAHQSALAASAGDRVAAGEVIGYIGSTGLSTGPHLHFETRVCGNPVDPDRDL